ncbi:DAZ-associated protein [Echinococcus granulosus]|uniref:DAZ-associated protein n=1 Tax=Echinococcus granulosus TaxID=6210 RepID=W6UUU5_ECHGR|nr:DAZ-associated protein [Echinococcus granulosus]EUB57179.1 DAZ-associated protein [Echinococcus granulosus]
MASTNADLICGVCTKLMSDPYSLPCGHTFCLRPCLLPHARAMTARCIRCHATFDLAKLRPNYTIAAKLTLISTKHEQQQDQMPKQQAKNKGDCVEEMSIAPAGDQSERKKWILAIIVIATSVRSAVRNTATVGQLKQYFAQYGTVTGCCIARDYKTKESRGFGFVTFREEAHAARALAGCPHFIEGGPISVRPSILKAKKEKTMPVSSSAKYASLLSELRT